MTVTFDNPTGDNTQDDALRNVSGDVLHHVQRDNTTDKAYSGGTTNFGTPEWYASAGGLFTGIGIGSLDPEAHLFLAASANANMALDAEAAIAALRMATSGLTYTLKGGNTASATTDGTSFASTSNWAPTNGRDYLVIGYNLVASGTAASVSGIVKTDVGSLSELGSVLSPDNKCRVWAWKGIGTGNTSSKTTVSFGATQSACDFVTIELTDDTADVATFATTAGTATGTGAAGADTEITLPPLTDHGLLGFSVTYGHNTTPTLPTDCTNIDTHDLVDPETPNSTYRLFRRNDVSGTTLTQAGTGVGGDTNLSLLLAIRLASTSRSITGMTNGQLRRTVLLRNDSDTDDVTVEHDDSGSTAANRFYCPNNSDLTLRKNGAVWVSYDAAVSRWRVVGA